jgi:hypothetical protein
MSPLLPWASHNFTHRFNHVDAFTGDYFPIEIQCKEYHDELFAASTFGLALFFHCFYRSCLRAGIKASLREVEAAPSNSQFLYVLVLRR